MSKIQIPFVILFLIVSVLFFAPGANRNRTKRKHSRRESTRFP